ncbi:hypothetical protein NDU88_004096 [Pleurodeles waltl]|uniref:Uncharacterized protein n=1 Tax=Pleurodeles waltl TaxID=8319 RepID=A0AAV7LIT0_PLEWA|nr:hypothetical protein NDU88_004096 [Pleurodeles waltl]
MPRKCQLWVQRSCHRMEEAVGSARTTGARNFPFGGWMSHVVKSRAEKDRKQALLAARVAQDKEPTQKQAAPAEVPEHALRSGVNRSSPEVTKEGPTTPDDNSGGRAMQARVPATQAWLCTKEILEECTGAGVAAKHAVPSNAV